MRKTMFQAEQQLSTSMMRWLVDGMLTPRLEGSFDSWGGSSFAKCTTLLNEQFERVFYKNDFSFGVTIFNVYMVRIPRSSSGWNNLTCARRMEGLIGELSAKLSPD